MKRKELEKLPVLRATTAMLKQAENEPMIESGYFRQKIWLPETESQCMSCFLTMMRRIS